ncbi:MAG: uroporphyrinogen decarboxylase family protein [Candidatus Thorarchaeota archaeon]
MKSRDRTLAAIEGIPDRIPFNPFIMHFAAAIDQLDYSNVYCKDATILAEAQIKCANTFGIDHVNVSTDAYREASAWGVEIDFSGHTPMARTHLALEKFDSIETPDLNSSIRVQDRVEAVRLLKERVGDEQCIVGWIEAPFAEICCLFGLIEVLKMARKPAWSEIVRGLIQRILPVQQEFAMMQIEAGADIIGAGDSAVSQIGPRRYNEACLEPTKKLFQEINKQVPSLYHVCGDSSVIDRDGNNMLKLVAESGTSVLDIDYQVDMTSAKNMVGNQVCLRGNTNTTILGDTMYNVSQVTEEISQTIQAGKQGGRFMYAAGCEWPWHPFDLAARNLRIGRKLIDEIGGY